MDLTPMLIGGTGVRRIGPAESRTSHHRTTARSSAPCRSPGHMMSRLR